MVDTTNTTGSLGGTTFTGTGEEQKRKQDQLNSLIGNVASIQGQLTDLGTGPGVSSQLSSLQEQQRRNENLIGYSLNLAKRLGGYFGGIGSTIRNKVSAGFFVAGTSSRVSTSGGKTISTFGVTFGKLTQGLSNLIARQKNIDQQNFNAQRSSLLGQLNIAQDTLSSFERSHQSVRDSLKRERDAVALLRKRRGRLSLRTKGSRTGLLEESKESTETTNKLLI